jgi:2-oxoisovalerate dehydrogenase E2 component (dihydrolipoyl transacylase)
MMTDKATVEMESPVSGTVVEVAGEVGDVVAIGAALVVIEVEGEGEEGPSTGSGRADVVQGAAVPEAVAAPPLPPPLPVTIPTPALAEPVEASAPTPAPHAKVLASPAVRARAAQLGIDLVQVKPAEDGRVRHADLDAFLAYNAAGGFRSAGSGGADQDIKVVGLRRRIAENMAASKRHIPHFSYVEECDATALEVMRAQLNASLGSRPKLTMLPLLITAICRALGEFPMLNARYDDEAGMIHRSGAVHLGMATQTPGGLMVPVIRDAQNRNLWQLAGEIGPLAAAAREGTAKSEELSGSTITITSLGPLGGVATTPVINRPEVAIIGPNRIVERPMFVPDGIGGERIEKRKLMNLSISCDHRVVDGHDAASFVQAVRRLIETPLLLLAD